jgi:hypothetical protein
VSCSRVVPAQQVFAPVAMLRGQGRSDPQCTQHRPALLESAQYSSVMQEGERGVCTIDAGCGGL